MADGFNDTQSSSFDSAPLRGTGARGGGLSGGGFNQTAQPADTSAASTSASTTPTLDASGRFQYVNGAWSPYTAPAASGGAGASTPAASSAPAGGLGYTPSYYENVQATTPGFAAADVNNPRFNQFATQDTANNLSNLLRQQGFNSQVGTTNFGGGVVPTAPQYNLNMNGNQLNAGLIQQRLEQNRRPDGTINWDFFNKQMQDELNSLGNNGSPSVAGQGMGNPLGGGTPGINYSSSGGPNYASPGGGGGQGGGGMQGYGPGPGGASAASISMQPQGPAGSMSGMGMANTAFGGGPWGVGSYGSSRPWGGVVNPGWGGGGGYGGGMPMRRPALGAGYGGFGGGMLNSAWFPQSEPNMRPGMQTNFRQAGGSRAPGFGNAYGAQNPGMMGGGYSNIDSGFGGGGWGYNGGFFNPSVMPPSGGLL